MSRRYLRADEHGSLKGYQEHAGRFGDALTVGQVIEIDGEQYRIVEIGSRIHIDRPGVPNHVLVTVEGA